MEGGRQTRRGDGGAQAAVGGVMTMVLRCLRRNRLSEKQCILAFSYLISAMPKIEDSSCTQGDHNAQFSADEIGE